jgi:hypothetical protein
MPPKIRVLAENTINQIAAGEVIESPSSVIKELCENSLDAGAKKIIVEIQAGGLNLLRVTDDGCGMGKDDAILCLERHATSKIHDAKDLFKISTMGFRGEAMASIASISRMTLTTSVKRDRIAAGSGCRHDKIFRPLPKGIEGRLLRYVTCFLMSLPERSSKKVPVPVVPRYQRSSRTLAWPILMWNLFFLAVITSYSIH